VDPNGDHYYVSETNESSIESDHHLEVNICNVDQKAPGNDDDDVHGLVPVDSMLYFDLEHLEESDPESV
jgi:hypothetical protein